MHLTDWFLNKAIEALGYFRPLLNSPLIRDRAYVSRTLCSVLPWFEVHRNTLDLKSTPESQKHALSNKTLTFEDRDRR